MTLFALLVACGVSEGARYSVPVPPTVEDPHAPPVDTGPPPVPPPPVTPAGPLDCHAYDQDEDGFDLCTDCDDTDPTTYPGAPAVCFDGQDNSCGTLKEQPCAFEGVHRLGDVGAEAFGSGAPVVITDLWGDITFVEVSQGFRGAVHSGQLATQHPYLITPDRPNAYYFSGTGDMTGDGEAETFLWDQPAQEAVVRVDPLDSSGDILFPPLGLPCGPSGDADGDGVSDLAVQAEYIGEFTLFTQLQPGATYAEDDATAIYTFDDPAGYMYTTYTTAEDIDGDGLVDAVWNRYQYWDKTNRDGAVGTILSPLQGTHSAYDWDSSATLGHFLASTPPTLLDVDDDGRVELLAIGGLETDSEPGLVIVPFDDTGNIDADAIRMAWTDRSLAEVGLFGDLDGDERPELVISHVGGDGAYGVSLYPLPGIAHDYDDAIVTFSLADVDRLLWSPDFAVGDLDDDGDPDLGVGYSADGRDPQATYFLYPGGL